jgi:hypothetical protein
MPRKNLLEQFIDQLALAVAAKLNGARLGGRGTGRRGARGPSPLRGKHFSAAKMRFRWPDSCKNRSLGPKNHWLCSEHLPKWSPKVKAAMQEAKA